MQRLFGTNGVRGVTNESMTVELAVKLGKAVGSYVQGNIALATDTRTSSGMLKNAVTAGLLSTGCNVYDAGVAPSPALQYYVKRSEADAGVIITASHNPPEFNGIKVVDADGTELPREKEEKIEELYFSGRFQLADWKEIGTLYDVEVLDLYMDGILSQVNVERIKEKRYRVVLDCGNGAACVIMPYILSQMAEVVTLNAQPDGTFPGRNSEPTEDNIRDLMRTVKAIGADLGIAYDGDADRAIFVDGEGSYVYGDKSLAIVAGYMVERDGGTVVTPVSTSSCVEEYVRKKGGNVVYTRVGAPIVARKMIEIGALFGGEENGGLIFSNHQYCRDAGMASAAMLEVMAAKERTLSELVKEVPSYALVKTKVRCEKKDIIERLKEKIQEGRCDYTDGIKVYTEDGWVLMRPSGTEPILRIYAEGKSEKEAQQLISRYRSLVEEELK